MIKKTHLVFAIFLLALITEMRSETKVYFNSSCESALIEQINKAQTSIYCAIFTFTRFSIAKFFIVAKKRGVKVHIITDAKQANTEYGRKIVNMLKESDIRIGFIPKNDRTHMHHKFSIIDSKMIVTGSYNYTTAASKYNDENLIIFTDKKLALKFTKEWQRLNLLVQKKTQSSNELRKSSTKNK